MKNTEPTPLEILWGLFFIIVFVVILFKSSSNSEKIKDNQINSCELELKTEGNSMVSTIKENDTIRVDTCSDRYNFKVGDIIVFLAYSENEPRIIMHRIVGMEEYAYLTKGDNNELPDGYVTPISIIGKFKEKIIIL